MELIDPRWFKVLLKRPLTDDTTAVVSLVHGQEKWSNLPEGLFIRSLLHVTSSRPVTCLVLKHHVLSTLPRDFTSLSSTLMTLDLSYNRFVMFPDVVCEVLQLKELFLNNNQLSQLPDNISSLANLQVLHVQQNKLTKLPPSLGQVCNLVVLNLEHNQLTSLPNELNHLKNLTTLLLANNKLEQLPATITDLDKLELLHVANNEVKELPEDDLSCMVSLKQLNIANNKVKMLPFSLARLPLQGLSLSGNPLVFPPMSVCRQGLDKIKQYLTEKAMSQHSNNNTHVIYSKKPYNSDSEQDSDTPYEYIDNSP